jgi:hypothetical protein
MTYEFFLIFLKNKSRFNVLAWLIRLAQKTDYNHVEIVCRPKPPKLGAGMSYGAVHPQSRKLSYPLLFQKYEMVDIRPIDIVVDQYKAIEILNGLLGKPYSFLQLIVILFKVAFHALARPASKVRLNLDKYLICTELAGIFLRDAAGADFPSVEALTLKDLQKDWIKT